jgi:hypothetical protein
LLDLGRISGGDVIVVSHRRRSRRSYARQKRTPRPERKREGIASMKYFSDFCISYCREFDHSRGFRLKATKGFLKAGYAPIHGFKKL